MYNLIMSRTKIYSVTESASRLGLSTGRIRELIREGKLFAQKVGREWAILEPDLLEFEQLDRPTGRPPVVGEGEEE